MLYCKLKLDVINTVYFSVVVSYKKQLTEPRVLLMEGRRD